MNKKISVIVPVYNVEKYLNRCVDSILAQTYQNLEIILVDDGSPDNCPQICDDYGQKDLRIKVIHKENGGLSSARNAGLDIATGDYIGFVDSDDYVAPDMYSCLYNRIKGTETYIANCMYVRAFDSGETTPSRVPHHTDEDIATQDYLEELLLHVGDVSVCSKLFPRVLIGDLRFIEGKLNEDLLFMIQLMRNIQGIKFVGSLGYYYYVREKSITSRYGKTFIDMQRNAMWVLEYVRQNHPILKKQAVRFALYQNMAFLLAIPIEEAVKANEVYCDALKFIRKNTIKNIFNSYLKAKEKVILLGLAIMPQTIAKIFQKKHR